MNKTFLLCLLLAAAACGNQPDSRQSTSASSEKRDTLANVPDTALYNFSLKKYQKRIKLEGKKFLLEVTAQLYREKPYLLEYGAEVADVEAYAGFDAAYEVTLKDISGQQVFSTSFTKDHFKNVADWSCLATCDAVLPDFEGYLPDFKAFAFTIDFAVPDSDVSETCLFLLDDKGKMVESCVFNIYGGDGGAGEGTISASLPFILTWDQIIHADGRKINLENDKSALVGTFFIPPGTILVIREYHEKDNPKNAVLMDINGREIHAFSYKGYYETLDYNVPMAIDAGARSCYLLDDAGKLLTIIPYDNPAAATQILLDKLKIFDGKKLASEVISKIDTETGTSAFYTDTITKSVRYKSSLKSED